MDNYFQDILVTDSKATHLAVISVGTDMARQRQAAKLLSKLMKSNTVSGSDKYSKVMKPLKCSHTVSRC